MYYGEQDFLQDLVELCVTYEFFDTEEDTLFFAEELINQNVYIEFLEELAGVMEVDSSQYLTEGAAKLGYMGVRALVNALSKGGRLKAGLKAGTAMGKKAETVVKGAAASSSIRSARAARIPYKAPTAGRPLAAQQLKKSADVSKATKALPAVGKTSAPKPVAAPKSAPAAKSSGGWQRHNQAVSTAQQKVAQAKTVAQAFMKAFTGKAKKVSGAAADPWKQFKAKAPVQRGLPKTGPSSTLPGRTLPSSGMRAASAVRRGQGSTAGVRSTTMKDPYPAKLQKPAPKPKFGNQTDVGVPEKPTKYMKLTSPKATPAPTPKATPAPKQVAPKANKMTSGADALNKARRALAGSAAAGVAAGAAAPLVSGKKKSSAPTEAQKAAKATQQKAETKKAMAGDSRDPFKRSSKELAGDFDKSFAAARGAGRKTFSWRGKEYNTKLRGEEVDTFDIIKDHLISEGYVDSEENALKMMAYLDEAAITKLLLKLQKLAPKLSAAGKKQASKIINKQTRVDADLARQKMSPVHKQQAAQRAAREVDDKIHPSLSAAERNSSMR